MQIGHQGNLYDDDYWYALKLKMYGFCKLISILQPLNMAEVGHPPVDVFQIENLEDGVVSHVLV